MRLVALMKASIAIMAFLASKIMITISRGSGTIDEPVQLG
jgi:hypothetical protein